MQRTFTENISNQPLAPNRAALTANQGPSVPLAVGTSSTNSSSTSSSISNPRLLNSMSSFFDQTIESGTKGESIHDIIKELDGFVPAIPDAVTEYYMRTCGLNSGDPRVVRLISLATEKFMSDLLLDASYRLRLERNAAPSRQKKDERRVLTPELLDPVLKERGINVIRAPYHT